MSFHSEHAKFMTTFCEIKNFNWFVKQTIAILHLFGSIYPKLPIFNPFFVVGKRTKKRTENGE